MKLKRPSPAMAVAIAALVMSMTGGAIAAVNFAKNAGAVDGYSAVKAKSSNGKAAGKLVATYPGGSQKGKLPFRFLSGAASKGALDSLAASTARVRNAVDLIPVLDNQTTAPKTEIDLDLGDFQVSCVDEAEAAGNENAATRITVTNRSGIPIGLTRTVGGQPPTIQTVENGAQSVFAVGAENTFQLQLQGGEKTVLVFGTARQGGQGTPESACGVWATALFAS
jgi:hypothetical protein